MGGFATYSSADDRLRLYTDHQLDAEDYWRVRDAGFIWEPGPRNAQRVFAASWSPEREDLLLGIALDIFDEKTTSIERPGVRSMWDEPPVLDGRAHEAFLTPEYWVEAARAVITSTRQLERPGKVARRIQALEMQLDARARMVDPRSPDWVNACVQYAASGWKQEAIEAAWRERVATPNRWIAHLENRLAYERMVYQAAGGFSPRDHFLEAGGAVEVYGTWHEIERVNWRRGALVSVDILIGSGRVDTVETEKITAVLSPEEFRRRAAQAPRLPQPAPWEVMTRKAVEGDCDPDLAPASPALVTRLIEAAKLEPSLFVLEPEAGAGTIADAIRQQGCAVTAVEIDPRLAGELRRRRHNTVCANFLEYWDSGYNRVVMLPPFSNGQDIDHVWHAHELLAPGGLLVAVMSEESFTRDDVQTREFGQWLIETGGKAEKLPDDIYQPCGVNTPVRLVTIEKA